MMNGKLSQQTLGHCHEYGLEKTIPMIHNHLHVSFKYPFTIDYVRRITWGFILINNNWSLTYIRLWGIIVIANTKPILSAEPKSLLIKLVWRVLPMKG